MPEVIVTGDEELTLDDVFPPWEIEKELHESVSVEVFVVDVEVDPDPEDTEDGGVWANIYPAEKKFDKRNTPTKDIK